MSNGLCYCGEPGTPGHSPQLCASKNEKFCENCACQNEHKFVQIVADRGSLYALDNLGDVWVYTTFDNSDPRTVNVKELEIPEWRRLSHLKNFTVPGKKF